MVTLTIHDRDALAVLALINVARQMGAHTEAEHLDRVASAIRCALLLCDCGLSAPAAPPHD